MEVTRVEVATKVDSMEDTVVEAVALVVATEAGMSKSLKLEGARTPFEGKTPPGEGK